MLALGVLCAVLVGCSAEVEEPRASTSSNIGLGEKRHLYDLVMSTRKEAWWCDEGTDCAFELTAVVRNNDGRELHRECKRSRTDSRFDIWIRYADYIPVPFSDGAIGAVEVSVEVDRATVDQGDRTCTHDAELVGVFSKTFDVDPERAMHRSETDDFRLTRFYFRIGDEFAD